MPVVSRAPMWRSPSPESKRREARRERKCPHGRHVEGGDGDGEHDEDDGDETAEEKQRVKNRISRHREDVSCCISTLAKSLIRLLFLVDSSVNSADVLVCYNLSTDPTAHLNPLRLSFRNIGFPSTQDVAVINEEAERQKEAKRAEMRREAEKKDGKYRRVEG
jgi:hypothetical protein